MTIQAPGPNAEVDRAALPNKPVPKEGWGNGEWRSNPPTSPGPPFLRHPRGPGNRVELPGLNRDAPDDIVGGETNRPRADQEVWRRSEAIEFRSGHRFRNPSREAARSDLHLRLSLSDLNGGTGPASGRPGQNRIVVGAAHPTGRAGRTTRLARDDRGPATPRPFKYLKAVAESVPTRKSTYDEN